MDLTFPRAENVECNTVLTIYLRYTHLEIPVFTAILNKIREMHQTIVKVVSNTFLHPAYPDEKLRNILQIESIAASTIMKSITVVCREGWTPDFQSEKDNFLVDVPYSLGIPSIITWLLFSTLDEAIVSSSNILMDMKKTLENELYGNHDVKRICDDIQSGGAMKQLAEQALELIQEAKSTDALRSVSVNGFNILSFDINRRKYKRYFVQFPVKIIRKEFFMDAILENVSRGGCVMKLSGAMETKSDEGIIIQFPGFDLTSNDVRYWQSGDEAYLRAIFDSPMEESQLRAIPGLMGLH